MKENKITVMLRILIAIIGIVLITISIMQCNKLHNVESNSTIIEKIDSIKDINNNLKNSIIELDSIKHVKIEQVKVLNNDSTLTLFYELIRK